MSANPHSRIRAASTLPPSAKEPRTYEHVPPESVGNARKLLVSNQAGRSNILAELSRIGMEVDKDDPRLAALLDEVKTQGGSGLCL